MYEDNQKEINKALDKLFLDLMKMVHEEPNIEIKPIIKNEIHFFISKVIAWLAYTSSDEKAIVKSIFDQSKRILKAFQKDMRINKDDLP